MLCLKKIASHQRTTVHYVTQRWHPHIGEEENSACKLHNSHKPEQVAMHLQKFLAFILLVQSEACASVHADCCGRPGFCSLTFCIDSFLLCNALSCFAQLLPLGRVALYVPTSPENNFQFLQCMPCWVHSMTNAINSVAAELQILISCVVSLNLFFLLMACFSSNLYRR